jgi:hypothetical protein
MKKSILKGALLLTSMIALAAPAGASAGVWGPVGSTGTLKSTNSLVVHSIGSSSNIEWTCTTPQQFGYHVRNPASGTLDITSATLGNCSTVAPYSGCTITQAATGLPWTATASGTTALQLNVGNVNLTFSGTCGWAGATVQMSGSMLVPWVAASHSAVFSNASGLSVKYMGSLLETITYTMGLSDVGQTLTLT